MLDLTAWTGWNAVADVLAAAGAEVQSLRLQRAEQGASGRCRFTGPSADEARGLADALIEAGLVRGAQVEHLILKSNEPAS
ncbi:MAG: hypothetical protein NW206_03485 [Hyphomonadaceae bacterium]|nr:hypothetical protein [Hyphomonadaceae bacterium]